MELVPGSPGLWAPSCDVRPGWEDGEKGRRHRPGSHAPSPLPSEPALEHLCGDAKAFPSQCCLNSADGLKPLRAKSQEPSNGRGPELMEGRAKVG